jgi:ATP-dependent DNA ligase
MLAKIAESLPEAEGYLFEPKWDGFRAIVFRSADDLYIQSRDERPFDRYFPDLHDALLDRLPKDCVIDGEIVIATAQGLDFDALQMRLHPALRASRCSRAPRPPPSSPSTCSPLRAATFAPSRCTRAARAWQKLLAKAEAPLYLTPATRDRAIAAEWLARFEGAGLDGVIAKPENAPYQPGKRAMLKVKHARTAECVVAGFRWYKTVPVRSAPSSSASTTTQACSTTSASRPRSRWRCASSSRRSSSRCGRTR